MGEESLEITRGDTTSVYVKKKVPAQPVSKPIGGLSIMAGEKYVFVVHDDIAFGGMARTLASDKITIAITNEMFVPRRWYFRDDIGEWRVDQYSKISFWPEELEGGWYPYFFGGMTEKQHELFNVSGTGWRDSKANAIIKAVIIFMARTLNRTFLGFRPDGVNIYNFILCGGALLKKAFEWRQWTIFDCQDTNYPPLWETYIDNPAHVFKQGVCGHNKFKQSFYGSVNHNTNGGDLFIPTACPTGRAAILTTETRPLPVPPFDTWIDGTEMTVTEMRVVASEIFGKCTDGEWYYLLEQAGTDGNQGDFIFHVPAELFPALPVPYVRWP